MNMVIYCQSDTLPAVGCSTPSGSPLARTLGKLAEIDGYPLIFGESHGAETEDTTEVADSGRVVNLLTYNCCCERAVALGVYVCHDCAIDPYPAETAVSDDYS